MNQYQEALRFADEATLYGIGATIQMRVILTDKSGLFAFGRDKKGMYIIRDGLRLLRLNGSQCGIDADCIYVETIKVYKREPAAISAFKKLIA